MGIQSLRCFIAVAECGSFSKAAEHLYTIQPNISRHIKRLEEELEAPLFIREGKTTKLTNVGEMVFAEVKDIVTKYDQLKDKINKYNLGEYGQLRIGYNGDFNSDDLANILNSFCVKYPNVEISLFQKSIESDLLSAFYEDELDLIITSAAIGLMEMNDICFKKIASNELLLVVPHEHRFRSYNIVKKKDIIGEPMIQFSRHMSPIFHNWLMKSFFINNKSTVIHESDLQNALLKVASGKGICVLSKLLLKTIPEKVHVVNFEYDRNEINVDLMLFWKKANQNPSLSLLKQSISKNIA